MDDTIRNVAWAIAEAWWRKHHRQAGGTVPEATSSADYADNFWQGWAEEAKAAIDSMNKVDLMPAPLEAGPPHAHY